jgi:hypothetical protein
LCKAGRDVLRDEATDAYFATNLPGVIPVEVEKILKGEDITGKFTPITALY